MLSLLFMFFLTANKLSHSGISCSFTSDEPYPCRRRTWCHFLFWQLCSLTGQTAQCSLNSLHVQGWWCSEAICAAGEVCSLYMSAQEKETQQSAQKVGFVFFHTRKRCRGETLFRQWREVEFARMEKVRYFSGLSVGMCVKDQFFKKSWTVQQPWYWCVCVCVCFSGLLRWAGGLFRELLAPEWTTPGYGFQPQRKGEQTPDPTSNHSVHQQPGEFSLTCHVARLHVMFAACTEVAFLPNQWARWKRGGVAEGAVWEQSVSHLENKCIPTLRQHRFSHLFTRNSARNGM